MSSKYIYNKILFILFSVSIFLLISHLVLSLAFSKVEYAAVVKLSDDDIFNKFKESLESFALKDQWIKTVKSKDAPLSYQVKVPNDLTISQILFDLAQRYYPYNIKLNAKDKKLNVHTLANVIQDGENKLSVEFIIDDKIKRIGSTTAVFIYDREKNDPEYDSLFRYLPRDYSALLLPSKSASAFGKWLKGNGFDYAVLINNYISELDYRLAKDFSEERVKLVVRNLVGSFPNTFFFLIDKNSDIYSSPTHKLLQSELEKRNIKLLPSDFLEFMDVSQPGFSEKFVSFIKANESEKKNKIAVSFDAFVKLNDEINKLLRQGYKFAKLIKDEIRI